MSVANVTILLLKTAISFWVCKGVSKEKGQMVTPEIKKVKTKILELEEIFFLFCEIAHSDQFVDWVTFEEESILHNQKYIADLPCTAELLVLG